MPNILELTRQVLKHHLVFSMWERTAQLGLKVSFAWNASTTKKQTPSIIPIHWHALCVRVLVYTHHMHSSNSANNTLHLFKAGSKEYKQWFMRKLRQCFPIPCSCLFVESQPSTVSKWICWSRPAAKLSGGCEMEGTFEAGVRMWQGDWFQSWACATLEAAIQVFSFLAFKWLPFLVITALNENTWSIHSDFQILHLETSHCLVSPCTLLPPCLLDCRLGGKKLWDRSIHCPEVFQVPPWKGKAQ